jgi:hypothetical protein
MVPARAGGNAKLCDEHPGEHGIVFQRHFANTEPIVRRNFADEL